MIRPPYPKTSPILPSGPSLALFGGVCIPRRRRVALYIFRICIVRVTVQYKFARIY